MIDDFKPKAKNQNNSIDDNPYVGQVFRPQPELNNPPQNALNQRPTQGPAPAGPYRPVIAPNQSQPVSNQIQQRSPNQNQASGGFNNVANQRMIDSQDNINQVEMAEQKNMLPTKKKTKLKKALFIILIILLLVIGSFAAWWFGLRDTNKVNQVSINNSSEPVAKVEPETPKVFLASLSGLEVDEATSKRPVTAIMIENSEEARPQSGLLDADVVYEAIAEGGITRFVALYQSKKPDYIGPVRSARPYYVEWAKMYDASYVHAGGSPDALQLIKNLSVKDVNAFTEGEDAFYRVNNRFSPHNLYSNFNGLDKINQNKNFTTSNFTPWARKVDSPQTPTAKNISISISSPVFNPSYAYDPTDNTYKRSQNNEQHKDEKQAKQLSPKTVLVMVMKRSQDGIYSIYDTSGSGTFLAFQDGVVSEGTWNKTGTSLYTFKDKFGLDYNFNRGQTWVSIVTNKNDVKYTP